MARLCCACVKAFTVDGGPHCPDCQPARLRPEDYGDRVTVKKRRHANKLKRAQRALNTPTGKDAHDRR